MPLPVNRNRSSGKIPVFDIVQGVLYERGQETIARLHKAYKEKLKEIYAPQLKPFLNKEGKAYKNPYRIINGEKIFLKKPPKGMSYASFCRYMNRWLNEGLVEKAETSTESKLTPEQLEAGLQYPVYYKLSGTASYTPVKVVKEETKKKKKSKPKAEPVEIKPESKKVVPAKKTEQKHVPDVPKVPEKPELQPVMLSEEEVRSLIADFKETMNREPTKAEVLEIIQVEVQDRATRADIELLKNHLLDKMDEERKAVSVRKLTGALKELDYDIYEGLEDVEDAIESYQDAERGDKEDAFFDIIDAIENIELKESDYE